MLNRRSAMTLLSGSLVAPKLAWAGAIREITWEDLIPPGVPYSEIIGVGEVDEVNDLWNPVYDANGVILNEDLSGKLIKMPGFIVPFDLSTAGLSNFLLVPYNGACIHSPPPPPNQLVQVHTTKPWPSDKLWDPVWVTGTMGIELQSTSLGQSGYSLLATHMEEYVW